MTYTRKSPPFSLLASSYFHFCLCFSFLFFLDRADGDSVVVVAFLVVAVVAGAASVSPFSLACLIRTYPLSLTLPVPYS